MNKLILAIILLLPTLAWGQTEQSEQGWSDIVTKMIHDNKMYDYKNAYYGEEFAICGLEKSICIFVKSTDTAFFMIENKKLGKLKESLALVKNKFCEWDSIAKANSVTNFSKDIEVKLHKQLLGWSKNRVTYACNKVPIEFVFKVDSLGNTSIISSFYATAARDISIVTQYFLAFSSPDDLQEFIDSLDTQKINHGLKKISQRDPSFSNNKKEDEGLFK